MAKEVICIQCSMTFPDEDTFQVHKKSGHTTKGMPLSAPGIEPPTPEFLEQVARIEGKNKNPTIEPTPVTSLPPGTPTIPIKLTYKFVGNCPTHNIPVDTFELDAGGKHYVTAVCIKDKEQLETREVVKL